MFNLGGINFKISGDLEDLKKSLKGAQEQFKTLGKNTAETDKLFNSLNKSGEKAAKGFEGLNQRVKLLGANFGSALAAGGKFTALMAGPLIFAVTGLEAALGKLIRNLGINLVQASNKALAAGVELEEVQFGLAAAVDSYSRATGNTSLKTEDLIKSTDRLQRTTGVAAQEIQQAQLIMLEMSRSTGLTNDKIDELIQRAAEFSVVAKQDFLDVILAIDNAFVGLPQRLTNMGINVTEAALDMEKGSKSAAIYSKILESTEFAVGKVAESFDTTLFGALDRSTNAWAEFNRKTSEATLNFRGPFIKAIADASTELARLVTPLATVISFLQSFGGPLLVVVGTLVQFAAVIVGVQFALQAFRVILASNAIPVLGRFVSLLKGATATATEFAITSGVLSASVRTMTASQIAWNAVLITTKEVISAVIVGLKVLLRIFLPIAAVLAVITVAYQQYRRTLGATNEELITAAETERAHINVLEKALNTFDELKNKTNKTVEEQIEFNKAVKTLNEEIPHTITLLKEENKVLEDNTNIIRENLELRKLAGQARETQILDRINTLNKELTELTRNRDELTEQLAKQREKVENQDVSGRGESDLQKQGSLLRAQGEQAKLVAQSNVLLELNQKIEDIVAELARLLKAVGRQQEDAATKAELNLKKELERLERLIKAKELQIRLEGQLASIERDKIKAKQEVDEVPQLTREIQLLALKREELAKEKVLIDDLNKLQLEALNVQINEFTRKRNDIKTSELERPELDKQIKELKFERSLLQKEIEASDTAFQTRIAVLALEEQTLVRNFAKSVQDTLTKVGQETATIGEGLFANSLAKLKEFETETKIILANLKKTTEDTLKALPEGAEKDALRQQLEKQQEQVITARSIGGKRLQNELFASDLKALADHNQRVLELQKNDLENEVADLQEIIDKAGASSIIALERQQLKQVEILIKNKQQLQEQQKAIEGTLTNLRNSFEESTSRDTISTGGAEGGILEAIRGTGLGDKFNEDLRRQIQEYELQLKEIEQQIKNTSREIQQQTDPVKQFFIESALQATILQDTLSGLNTELERLSVKKATARGTDNIINVLNQEAFNYGLQLDQLLIRQKALEKTAREAGGPDFRAGGPDVLPPSQSAEIEAEARKQLAILNVQITEIRAKITEAKRQTEFLLADQVVAEAEAALAISRAREESVKKQLALEAELLKARADRLELEAEGEKAALDQIEAIRTEAANKERRSQQGLFADFIDGMRAFVNDVEGGFGFMRQAAIQTAQSMQQAFSTFFFDAFEGRFSSFKDVVRGAFNFLKKILADLIAQMITLAVIKAAVGGFGGGGGTAAAGANVGGFTLRQSGGIIKRAGGGWLRRAEGGSIFGQGIFGDRIPVLAEDREFMMKRTAVEKFGLANMQRINEGMMPIPRVEPGGSKAQEVTVINVVDPNEVPKYLSKNPKAITNIVSSDIARNGSTRTMIKR